VRSAFGHTFARAREVKKWRSSVINALRIASSSRHSNEAVASKQLRVYRTKNSGCSTSSRTSNASTLTVVETREDVVRPDALEEMFVASRGRFMSMAYSILRNREDAEEAVQEAFLSAHRHLRSFEGRSALKTWLTRIVVNAALMMQRKRKPAVTRSLSETDPSNDEDWSENIPDLHPNPEVVHAERETLQVINGILGKMKPALRQAFTMTYYNDLSGAEASAKLRISCGTFKARLFRARQQVLVKTERARISPMHKRPGPSLESWKRKGLQRLQGAEL
jgi:RNA polymerase sigma-70 factor (ECF subfamily)